MTANYQHIYFVGFLCAFPYHQKISHSTKNSFVSTRENHVLPSHINPCQVFKTSQAFDANSTRPHFTNTYQRMLLHDGSNLQLITLANIVRDIQLFDFCSV